MSESEVVKMAVVLVPMAWITVVLLAGGDVAQIRKIDEKAVIFYFNGDLECINIGGDSGICAVYDIVRKFMWR